MLGPDVLPREHARQMEEAHGTRRHVPMSSPCFDVVIPLPLATPRSPLGCVTPCSTIDRRVF